MTRSNESRFTSLEENQKKIMKEQTRINTELIAIKTRMDDILGAIAALKPKNPSNNLMPETPSSQAGAQNFNSEHQPPPLSLNPQTIKPRRVSQITTTMILQPIETNTISIYQISQTSSQPIDNHPTTILIYVDTKPVGRLARNESFNIPKNAFHSQSKHNDFSICSTFWNKQMRKNFKFSLGDKAVFKGGGIVM